MKSFVVEMMTEQEQVGTNKEWTEKRVFSLSLPRMLDVDLSSPDIFTADEKLIIPVNVSNSVFLL